METNKDFVREEQKVNECKQRGRKNWVCKNKMDIHRDFKKSVENRIRTSLFCAKRFEIRA